MSVACHSLAHQIRALVSRHWRGESVQLLLATQQQSAVAEGTERPHCLATEQQNIGGSVLSFSASGELAQAGSAVACQHCSRQVC